MQTVNSQNSNLKVTLCSPEGSGLPIEYTVSHGTSLGTFLGEKTARGISGYVIWVRDKNNQNPRQVQQGDLDKSLLEDGDQVSVVATTQKAG